MPHSCHQLSALLTAPVARGGLPPATCPLQEEACLHSADWERPALPLWPLPPLSAPTLSLFSLFLFYAPILSWPLSAPPSEVLAPSQPTPAWFSEAPTVGRGAALLCGSPGSGDVNQSWFLQAFLKWAQGPWWVSVVAGPDLQLIHREEVTFVLLIEAQFQHTKLPWLKGIQNLTNVSISFKWKIRGQRKLLLYLRSMMTVWYMWTLMGHLIN